MKKREGNTFERSRQAWELLAFTVIQSEVRQHQMKEEREGGRIRKQTVNTVGIKILDF